MNKIICVTGLVGSGKSVVSDYFVSKGFGFVRFGQITLDEVARRGLTPNEKLEKQIRENFRKKHGMAAFAKLNLPKFRKILKENNLVADGMYSFAEYKLLKKEFGKNFITIAVFAPPALRYKRADKRYLKPGDNKMRNRRFTIKEAAARDLAELENLDKGPTIAMADYTILNTKDKKFLLKQVREIYKEIIR